MERKIDRFDKYMKARDLNDNKVTLQLSLSIGTLGKSRKEGRDLSDRVIEQILNNYTDLNRVWLMTGEGEMLRGDTKSELNSLVSEPATQYPAPLDPLSQLIRNNTILVESNAVMADSVKKLTNQILELYSNKPPVSITEAIETMKKEIAETIRGELKNNHAREDVGCADAG